MLESMSEVSDIFLRAVSWTDCPDEAYQKFECVLQAKIWAKQIIQAGLWPFRLDWLANKAAMLQH